LKVPSVEDSSLAGRTLLVLQVGALLVLTATVASRLWQDHIWVGFLLIAVTFAVWLPELARPRFRRWWFVYVWGIFVYTILRAFADETGIPTHWTYAKHIDEFIFFGTNPVAALQDRFFSPSEVSWLDWAAVLVHWSFFIIPHAVAVAIFVWRRPQFPRYALVLAGTMWIGLVLFYLVPTAPPWLVASTGEQPNVFRVMDFVGGQVDPETYKEFYASLGEPNSVAAMPSIHEGAIFAMFLWAFTYMRRLSPLFLAYALLTGISLVFLGEHYVIDLLVGVAAASLCWYAVVRYSPDPGPAPSRTDTSS
jgi:membrane-associated phospholipid phosphatase